MCPDYRGVLISEVVLYTKAIFGTPEGDPNIEMSLFRSVLIREVSIILVYYSKYSGGNLSIMIIRNKA